MLPYFPNCYQNKQCGQQSPRALGPRSAWCLEPHRQEWAVSLKEKIILLGHKRGVPHLHWFLHFSWQPSLWFSGISMTYSKECASPLAALLGSWPGVRGCAPSFVTLLSGVKPTLPPPPRMRGHLTQDTGALRTCPTTYFSSCVSSLPLLPHSFSLYLFLSRSHFGYFYPFIF